MPTIEVSLPDKVENEIEHLVEAGDFVNRDQAVEELLSMGISAYGATESSTQESYDELFTQAVDDQQDPAIQDEPDDEDYSF